MAFEMEKDTTIEPCYWCKNRYDPAEGGCETCGLDKLTEIEVDDLLGIIQAVVYGFKLDTTADSAEQQKKTKSMEVIQAEELDKFLMAKKKANIEKKRNNYRPVELRCCRTCKKSQSLYYEEKLKCIELANERWSVNRVDPDGLCDKYVMRT